MTNPCRNDEIICSFALKHPPHCVYIRRCPAPVASDLEISECELLIAASRYTTSRRDDLARNKTLRSDWRFVIKENACCGVQPVRLTIVGNQPIRGCLGDRIGTARPKLRLFHSASGVGIAIALAGAGIVKAG